MVDTATQTSQEAFKLARYQAGEEERAVRKRAIYRDIDIGDEGDDVAAAQRFLQALGYEIAESELRAKRFGATTAAAKEKLVRGIQSNPLQMLASMLLALLTGEWDTLDRLLQVSEEDIEADISAPAGADFSYEVPDIARGDGVVGTGRAHRIRATEQLDESEIRSLKHSASGKASAHAAAALATKLIGQHEERGNRGPLVQLVNGYTGDPWCGGFANYIFDTTMPGVYDQGDFRIARSFMREGQQHGAFHSRGASYVPKIGDAVVFSRGRDPSKGHVGIITGYDPATREVTYVSGNDGNAVRERSFDLDRPPARLLGFTDSIALARAKGIDIASPVVASVSEPAKSSEIPSSQESFSEVSSPPRPKEKDKQPPEINTPAKPVVSRAPEKGDAPPKATPAKQTADVRHPSLDEVPAAAMRLAKETGDRVNKAVEEVAGNVTKTAQTVFANASTAIGGFFNKPHTRA